MPLKNLLSEIHKHINEITPLLEVFVDDSVHPSVEDCEKLKKRLIQLYENLAVYKHQLQQKDVSNYDLHAKVSEFVPKKAAQAEKEEETKPAEKIEKTEPKPYAETKSAGTRKFFTVGVNDKFRFINELFAQNSSEYHIAIEQLNNLNSWHEAEIYLNSLKSVYDWKDNSEVLKYFYAMAKKRFA